MDNNDLASLPFHLAVIDQTGDATAERGVESSEATSDRGWLVDAYRKHGDVEPVWRLDAHLHLERFPLHLVRSGDYSEN